MLARRLPSILPDLTFEEALEITKIHSVAGVLPKDIPIITFLLIIIIFLLSILTHNRYPLSTTILIYNIFFTAVNNYPLLF